MRTPSFLSDHLREFLRVKRIATLPEFKQAMGTAVDTTVFRKLKERSDAHDPQKAVSVAPQRGTVGQVRFVSQLFGLAV